MTIGKSNSWRALRKQGDTRLMNRRETTAAAEGSMAKRKEDHRATNAAVLDGEELLSVLVASRSARPDPSHELGLVIGELLAITDDGRTPLLTFPGQVGTAAVHARSIVDLHGAHIGHPVVLMFEGGDATKPIVMGVLRGDTCWPLEERPRTVTVDADGDRLVVSARDQLVLRCGKASLTLTKAGKVLIDGTYVSSRSSGVHRIKGGSIQLN